MTNASTINPTTDRIASLDEGCAILGISKATAYRGMAEGRLPKMVKITKRRKGWRLSELSAFIANAQ